MLVDRVRTWLLGRLNQPTTAIVYPPQQVSGIRPDLVVVDDGRVQAWIEVELGREDAEQMTVYRKLLSEPVYAIVGDLSQGGALSLQEISKHLRGLSLTPQQEANVEVFTTLVNQLAGQRQRFDYIMPDLSLRDAPLVAAVIPHIEDIFDVGVPPVRRGRVMLSTVANGGWTLRVYSEVAGMRSTALMWDQSLGRGTIRLPAQDKLMNLLGHDADAVRDYCDFLRRKGADVSRVSGQRSLAIDESVLCDDAEALAVHIRRLAAVYGQ
jgi:hypothetical protein